MRLGVIIFTLGAAFVAGGITAPATNAVSPPHVLYGAWVQQGTAATHADAVRALEANLGYTLALDNHYRPWANTFWRDEQDDIASGRTPMVSWTARGTTAAAIASGSQDATIARVADAVKALKSRVLVRFAYEMDQPKGSPRYLGSAADFIAAWRHVYTMFQTRGVTNARFVWSPIAANFKNGVAQSFYPGEPLRRLDRRRRLRLVPRPARLDLDHIRRALLGLLWLGRAARKAAHHRRDRCPGGPRRPGPQGRLVRRRDVLDSLPHCDPGRLVLRRRLAEGLRLPGRHLRCIVCRLAGDGPRLVRLTPLFEVEAAANLRASCPPKTKLSGSQKNNASPMPAGSPAGLAIAPSTPCGWCSPGWARWRC